MSRECDWERDSTLTVAFAKPVASGWRSASGWSLPMMFIVYCCCYLVAWLRVSRFHNAQVTKVQYLLIEKSIEILSPLRLSHSI